MKSFSFVGIIDLTHAHQHAYTLALTRTTESVPGAISNGGDNYHTVYPADKHLTRMELRGEKYH